MTPGAPRHPALEPRPGRPLAEAHLSERARLGVVLQAAGLLSLLEAAGWRLGRAGFAGAVIDGGERLTGVDVEPGRDRDGAQRPLAALLLALFGGSEGLAGRGEARRAARTLVARWRDGLLPTPADEAVEQILATCPFLERSRFGESLAGAFLREGREVRWSAGRGRRSETAVPPAATPADLVAAGRFAAALARSGDAPADEAERLDRARAHAGLGRYEAALAWLDDRRDACAEAVRLEAQLALGQIGAARETARRLERLDPPLAVRLAAGDAAARVFSIAGDHDAAADWAARALAAAGGAERLEAHLLAAVVAADRDDADAFARHLEAAAAAENDVRLAPRWHDLQSIAAQRRGDGARALHHSARRLVLNRRGMPRLAAGRAWNQIGIARLLVGDFDGAERAFAHALRLLRRCDGPLATTLAASNLADTRLRLGRLDGVEGILAAATVENLRSGNRVAQLYDEMLWCRLDLVRGELEAAQDRGRRTLAAARSLGHRGAELSLAALTARAAGWRQRPDEAAAALEPYGLAALDEELEPEERPFTLSLAGLHEESRAAAARSPFPGLTGPLVRGDPPRQEAWSALDALAPFRRARFVFDAEQVAPGAAPRALRAEAAAVLRRLGASSLASRLAREEARAWQALAEYAARPAGDVEALRRLFAACGHSEARLSLRDERGERRLLEGAPGIDAVELSTPCGPGELVLVADRADAPLRALLALAARDLPGPAPVLAGGASPLHGESPALAAAIDRLRRFADSDLPVLILGENGTGKELAAEFVHRASARRGREKVAINCAGIPESLLLSDLFGHVRGAFTGADRAHVGVFEQAQGSSLFLDEIGDLPASAQGAILRALQEREIRRVGEAVPRKVDVRVIAATHRDLARMVEEGRFRQDLYFRLKVATIELPPLRERGRDVLLLAERFLDGLRARHPGLRLTREAERALLAHGWPGNVRELRHVLEVAALLADGGRIAPEHLDLRGAPVERPAGAYQATMEEARRKMMVEALEATGGNRAAAARRLGMSRQNFSYLARRLGLKSGE